MFHEMIVLYCGLTKAAYFEFMHKHCVHDCMCVCVYVCVRVSLMCLLASKHFIIEPSTKQINEIKLIAYVSIVEDDEKKKMSKLMIEMISYPNC